MVSSNGKNKQTRRRSKRISLQTPNKKNNGSDSSVPLMDSTSSFLNQFSKIDVCDLDDTLVEAKEEEHIIIGPNEPFCTTEQLVAVHGKKGQEQVDQELSFGPGKGRTLDGIIEDKGKGTSTPRDSDSILEPDVTSSGKRKLPVDFALNTASKPQVMPPNLRNQTIYDLLLIQEEKMRNVRTQLNSSINHQIMLEASKVDSDDLEVLLLIREEIDEIPISSLWQNHDFGLSFYKNIWVDLSYTQCYERDGTALIMMGLIDRMMLETGLKQLHKLRGKRVFKHHNKEALRKMEEEDRSGSDKKEMEWTEYISMKGPKNGSHGVGPEIDVSNQDSEDTLMTAGSWDENGKNDDDDMATYNGSGEDNYCDIDSSPQYAGVKEEGQKIPWCGGKRCMEKGCAACFCQCTNTFCKEDHWQAPVHDDENTEFIRTALSPIPEEFEGTNEKADEGPKEKKSIVAQDEDMKEWINSFVHWPVTNDRFGSSGDLDQDPLIRQGHVECACGRMCASSSKTSSMGDEMVRRFGTI